MPRFVPGWQADRSANVSIIFALSLLPIIGMVGLSVDFALNLAQKAKLDAAADAATIAALTKTAAVINNSGTTQDAIAQGVAQGQSVFRANAGVLPFAPVPTPNIVVARNGQSLSSNVNYTTATPNQFGAIFGAPTSTIIGATSSSTVLKSFYQFIFVVDVSDSMTIGGTPYDIAGLQSDPNIACGFACHDPNHYQGPTDKRAIAAADGWKLKIDYVNTAVQEFIQDLQARTAGFNGQYSFSITTFGASVNTLLAPTSSFSAAQAGAASIDAETVTPPGTNWGYTRLSDGLSSTASSLTNVGDGSSPTQQITYVILLTDAVEDLPGGSQWGRHTDLAYLPQCSAVKNTGATLISIAAPYPTVTGDDQFNVLVSPLVPQLIPTMQSCASSPSWFFQANDGPGINTAVQAALAGILGGMTRLTH